ncbi:MAG TPA: hypothetical protein VJB89_01665 [Candidatus Nanoarchaeia archaeon]|nr:hypothetical protein [Candidatus Nanoarchaeia archaeon]
MKIESVFFVDNELSIKTDLGNSKVDINNFDINILKDKSFDGYNQFLELKGLIDLKVGKALLFGDYWSFINASRRTLPRVMSVCLEKQKGFSQYMLLSLDTKNIVSAVLFNERVKKILEKNVKTGFFFKKDIRENMLDIDILDLFVSSVKSVSNIIDFTVEIGVNFNSSAINDGEFYCYNNQRFNVTQHMENIFYYINKYDICYVENVFVEKDFIYYKEFCERVKNKCLVCSSFETNCYLLRSTVFFTEAELLDLKKKYINLVVDVFDVDFDINFAVGFGVPIIKVRENVLNVLERIKKQMTLLPKPI